MFEYNILAQITCTHESYGDRLWTDVELVPTRRTSKLASNLGLLFRMSGGKIQVLANSVRENDQLLLEEKLRDKLNLSFYIRIKDSYWSNFTNFTLDKSEIFYVSNREKFEEQDSSLVHGDLGDDALLQYMQGAQISLDGYDIESLALHGGEEYNVSSLVSSVNGSNYLNTRNLEEGKYELTDGGDNSITFYLTEEDAGHDGVFELSLDPGQHVINEDWTWNYSQYQISFQGNKTIWKYFFPKKKMEQFAGVRIFGEGEKDLFGEGEETVIYTGDEMICFSSQKELLLEATPNNFYQLRKNVNVDNRSEGIIINQLPTPDLKKLVRVGKDGAMYSELYINF